ncbi:MAG: DNA primase, partial [Oscillospiraceae bacterium]|nr:DNA primase [Oscillospiraceae bacterium]
AGVQAQEPGNYITRITLYNPSAKGMEIWLMALDTFFCGDEELIEYVQMIVGLAAIGKVFLEAIIIAYGEGRNGKSTFWNTVARVLGTYSGQMSADTLTVGVKRNVKPEMAELKGKRLVIAAELEEGMRLNTSMIKQLCSTDEIFAEKKYRDPFKFTPSHTLVLYTNHLPKVGASDAGTWRRLIVIPFNAKIEGSSDIKNYTDYLVENAGEAVMQWIIEGAEKVIAKEFAIPVPECVRKAISSYRDNNDWLSAFLDECCEIRDDYKEKSGRVYQVYREYCARNGEWARSTADFYPAIAAGGFEKHKERDGNYLHGLRLKETLYPMC